MSGSQGSVVVIDAMSFRRARDEFFLAPWATEEKLDLISIMPTEVHSTLGEHINCRMLIYDIGGVSASSHEILLEIHVLRTLFPAAALVIFSDDEGPESIVAAFNAGARGYLGSSMPPDLALQALSFLVRGGTYFPPAAIMVRRAGAKRRIWIAEPPVRRRRMVIWNNETRLPVRLSSRPRGNNKHPYCVTRRLRLGPAARIISGRLLNI
jgi:DNA-binding NarL/FixJ family response regulator